MKHSFSALAAALLLPVLSAAQAPPTAAEAVAGTAVIPRSALFGNPEKTQARISPDGKYISFIAPNDGVLNVWVGPRSDPSAAKPVTNDTKRGIRQHFWAYDNKHVLYHPGRRRRRELAPVRRRRRPPARTKDLTPYKGIAGAGRRAVVEEARRRRRRPQRPRRRVARPLGSEPRHRQARAASNRTRRSSPATTSTSISSPSSRIEERCRKAAKSSARPAASG